MPASFARICADAAAGRVVDAEARDRALAPLYDFLGAAPNPIPLKAALKAQGLGADLRLPLLPLEAPHVQRVDAILELIARAEADAFAA